ncbi:MAG: hypoxanthine-guanine phosphoribosyltransferase [Methylococcales bacterium]|nr:hypoxanthine-guanine phosphoribosyltransferase [Methylococcales bacterium]MCK5925220.1 hypoxanthine-guanine phosphoribosyltransferase [Methylococcales bacterium]
MLDEIKKIEDSARLLYSEKEVETAIKHMADKISLLLADRDPLVLCVMNGGLITTGRLMTYLKFHLTLDAINASRYRNQTVGSDIKWLSKPTSALKGRTILLVDDILDEGFTLEALYNYCQKQGASSIYSAVLINKKLKKKKPIMADFIALETEDYYLFGYGMDYKGYLRNAAGIYACQ